MRPKIYFTDFFNISEDDLKAYGAFNISLLYDLPLFVDPFLLYTSSKAEIRILHAEVIKYLTYLRDQVSKREFDKGLIATWFLFKEIKQTWLGFSVVGNSGSGLGNDFAKALLKNLESVFANFGQEIISEDSHIEKLCLIKDGVGRDNIIDFVTNLIKGFLCKYTESFALKYIDPSLIREVTVNRIGFDYDKGVWLPARYHLPFFNGDYVILTPREILTKDETWINRAELIDDLADIANAQPDQQLRAAYNEFIRTSLSAEATKSEKRKANESAVTNFPALVDYYIKQKEDDRENAAIDSAALVVEVENIFQIHVTRLVEHLVKHTNFYKINNSSYAAAHERVAFLKNAIENQDVYQIFYIDGKPVRREKDLQLMFKLCWYSTALDVNAEVNNGRGPADYKVSNGALDSTIVEFKLASNKKIKQNLAKQAEIYMAASGSKDSIKVVLFFNDKEFLYVSKILQELGLKGSRDIVLIDASPKVSASNAIS